MQQLPSTHQYHAGFPLEQLHIDILGPLSTRTKKEAIVKKITEAVKNNIAVLTKKEICEDWERR